MQSISIIIRSKDAIKGVPRMEPVRGTVPLISTVLFYLYRLSESNMQMISAQVEQLYYENSRNGM